MAEYQTPFIIRSTKRVVDEFACCEEGSYEDWLVADDGEKADITYGNLHGYTILQRHKSKIEVRSDDEAAEIYYRAASGTLQVHHASAAKNIATKLLPLIQASEDYAHLADTWPVASIGWS